MSNSLVIASLTLVVGVAIGSLLFRGPGPTEPETTPAMVIPPPKLESSAPETTFPPRSQPDLVDLQHKLQQETKAREALEEKVAALSVELSAYRNRLGDSGGADSAREAGQAASSAKTHADGSWFDTQALIDSGMSNARADDLRAHFEKRELDRLYLRDQFVRENWSRDQYREAIQKLNQQDDDFRQQLDESEYDAYLYASGSPNRVAVTDVLASAPAAVAGIRAGDLITRYDNKRVYNGGDLHSATTAGSRDTEVAVEVVRVGKTLQFYLMRGPLGIRMDSVSVPPSK